MKLIYFKHNGTNKKCLLDSSSINEIDNKTYLTYYYPDDKNKKYTLSSSKFYETFTSVEFAEVKL